MQTFPRSLLQKDSAQVFKAFDDDVWAVSITTNTGADRCDKIEFRGFLSWRKNSSLIVLPHCFLRGIDDGHGGT